MYVYDSSIQTIIYLNTIRRNRAGGSQVKSGGENNTTVKQAPKRTYHDTPQAPNDQRHLKVLRLFGLISLFFFLSYLGMFLLIGIDSAFPFQYIYMLNHIGNPLLYYISDGKFRKDVHEILTKK